MTCQGPESLPDAAGLPRRFGPYTLVRELGRGGMGVVFEATDRVLGRRVALKLLADGCDDEGRERFRREARATAQVRHPNIVEVYARGVIARRPYYAMALIPGRSLDAMARAGTLPRPRELAGRLAEVADALDVLHRAGVVHRDVKPSNIIVERSGRLVLADFGLARFGDAKLTASGHVFGTPAYMSPEQVDGAPENVDGRTDVYSLGASLYELIAGRPMFLAHEPGGMLRAIREDAPPRLRDRVPDVDGALEAIVLRAVEKRKEDRFESAGDLRDALLAYAAGEPVDGRPVSRASRPAQAPAHEGQVA